MSGSLSIGWREQGLIDIRLHWLGGDFPWRGDEHGNAGMQLDTPNGPFHVSVFNGNGVHASGDVVAGESDPPRGWLSRYYGEKVAVPSLAVEVNVEMPITFVTILGPCAPRASAAENSWTVEAGAVTVEFTIGSVGIVPQSVNLRSQLP